MCIGHCLQRSRLARLDDSFGELTGPGRAWMGLVLSTIIMSAIVIVGLTFRTAPKRFLLAWETFLIAVVYVVNLILLHRIA